MIYIMPLNYSMHKRCYNIIITWSFCLIDSISSNDDDDDGYRRKKKVRTAFSREQVTELEKKLSWSPLGAIQMQLVSNMTITTWSFLHYRVNNLVSKPKNEESRHLQRIELAVLSRRRS